MLEKGDNILHSELHSQVIFYNQRVDKLTPMLPAAQHYTM